MNKVSEGDIEKAEKAVECIKRGQLLTPEQRDVLEMIVTAYKAATMIGWLAKWVAIVIGGYLAARGAGWLK